jgi:hypothetical protein
MFKIGVQMWQFNNPNAADVFNNAFLMREKQFKVWWTPFYPRAEMVHYIQVGMTKLLGIVGSFKKYYY